MNTRPTIRTIKSLDDLPTTPDHFRRRFLAAVVSLDAAVNVAIRHNAAVAWWLARSQRLYWFEVDPKAEHAAPENVS